MEPTSNGIKVWQWVVTVIVIIILVLVGYKIFSKSSSNNTAEETNTEATTTESNTASKDLNRVMVSDQFPGNIVYISSVTLAKSGFVVIQSDNKGVPGDVIGYQYFDKGTNPGKITLNSSTKEGGLYYAVLYVDDGDKKFDSKKDSALKDASGNTIMKPFRVTAGVTEIKG